MKRFSIAGCRLPIGAPPMFFVALVLGLLAAPLAADAQEPGKAYRIGTLTTSAPTAPESGHHWASFFLALRELGYVDGQNLVIESRYDEGKPERLNDLAAELVRFRPDVIVAVATPKVRAAQQATKTIPIVMVAVVDPVGAGLVASLGRPGGEHHRSQHPVCGAQRETLGAPQGGRARSLPCGRPVESKQPEQRAPARRE
jgi:ABC transporter substrate binding protein